MTVAKTNHRQSVYVTNNTPVRVLTRDQAHLMCGGGDAYCGNTV